MVLSAALAVIAFDNTIVNVALPRLQEDLNATTSQLQWVVDAYSVLFAGLLLLAGSLGDRFGRRLAFTAGLVVFGVGSLMAGFASDAGTLTFWRAVMGVGGAFIMPSTLSILTQVFTDRRERAQAIGIWAAVAGGAVALGPIVGGVLLEQFDWNAIFWVNPPIVALVLIATVLIVPESKDPARPRLDPWGAVLSTLGVVALVVAIIQVPEAGLDAVTVGSAVVAVAALGAFVWWERRAPRPMLPMSLFRERLFTVAIVAVALVYFALMGTMFFMPQFLQLVQGMTPLQSGVAVLPGALGMLVTSLVSPRVAQRVGARRMVVAGLAVVTVGLSGMAFLTVQASYAWIGVSLLLMGIGLGMTLPQATNGVLASVPRERAGMGAAVNDGMSELGGSLGVAVLGAVMAAMYRGQIDDAIVRAGDAVNSVPTQVVEAVRESLASAILAIARLPADVADVIRDVAAQAFVTGMTWALTVGAVVAGVGVVLAWRMFPARVEQVEE